MKSAGKARSNGLYRHIRTSKEIIRNLLNYYHKHNDFQYYIIYSLYNQCIFLYFLTIKIALA